jgi:hypothetical protein
MGWARKILRVDLSKGSCKSEPLNMEWAQQYLGQRGLATKYFVEEVDPKVDPLSAANKMIMATGPLTGTMASTGGRYSIITKGAADRRHRLLELRRLLRRRAQDGRLGHDHFRGQVAQAGLSVDRERQGRTEGCRPPLGQDHLGHRRDHQEDPPGPAGPCLLDRSRRRERRALRLRGQRPASRRRPLRRRHRDGLEEPQGGRRARHPRRLRDQGLQGLHGRHRRRQEGPRRPPRNRPGPAQVRHPGADERDQRDGRAAHAQRARSAVRRRARHFGRSHAREAPHRRQGQPDHQQCLLRLHHRLRPHFAGRQGPLQRGQ